MMEATQNADSPQSPDMPTFNGLYRNRSYSQRHCLQDEAKKLYPQFRSRTETPRVITPENIPEFVIPSLENYRRRQRLQSIESLQQLRDQMQGEEGPTCTSLRLMYLKPVNEEISRNSESRGCGTIGMTLTHMNKTTSSYGFPILMGSPRRCSESIFHSPNRQPISVDDVLSRASSRTDSMGSSNYFIPSPVLYRHKFAEVDVEDTPDNVSCRSATQLAIFEKTQGNRHCISFSSTSPSDNLLRITIHEARLPSVIKNSEVYVRVCLHVPGYLWTQSHKSSLQVCDTDNMYVFNQSFTFRVSNLWRLTPFSSSRIRLCFKVFYQCVKRQTRHFVGKVSVPYSAVNRSHLVHTRSLEQVEMNVS